MSDCIFCKIVTKEIPSEIVFENEHILGFKDLNPVAPIHYLFIPKKHYATLNDIPSDEFDCTGEMMKAAVETAKKEGLAESGYRVLTNCNKNAGQVVFHLHAHLLGGAPLAKIG